MPYPQHFYTFFAKYIHEHTGIFIPEENFYQLDHRFARLIKLLNLKDESELYAAYNNNPNEDLRLVLIDVATNNETTFFRDKKIFDHVLKKIIPDLLNDNAMTGIDVWSCACSCGQEPYSLIMGLLEERSLKKDETGKVSVLATDISSEVLEKAKNGVYNTFEVQRGLTVKQLLANFTQKDDETFEIRDEIKKFIDFKKLNLVKDEYPRQMFDLILCRNILIYQKMEDRKIILNKLYEKLNYGGVLILGNGESLIGIDTEFETCFEENIMVYKKNIEKKKQAV